MKIRPLHKTLSGNYKSDDGNWLFVKNIDNEWFVYKLDQNSGVSYSINKPNPYFFYGYATRKSLIDALENANPN